MEWAVGLSEALDFEGRLEGLNLRSEAVPFDGDGNPSEEFLPALLGPLDPARKEDRPGARSPDRLGLEELPHGLEQPSQARQEGDRGRLCRESRNTVRYAAAIEEIEERTPSRNDKCVALIQVFLLTNEHDDHSPLQRCLL